MSAWNEIFARIFDGCERQENVSPEWLINPTTKRRLKLDRYYVELGIAVRFIGLKAKGQKRQSDSALMETRQRDHTREGLCNANGVQLVIIDSDGDILKQFDGFTHALTRARRVMAQSKHSDQHKQRWMPFLNEAQLKAISLRGLLSKNPTQMMNNLAESWRDRESRLLAELTTSNTTTAPKKRAPNHPRIIYKSEQRVMHDRFGEGVVKGISGEGDESTVSVLFDAENQRTFLISLIEDKMHII